MSPNIDSIHFSTPDNLVVELDLEVARASLVNCIIMANVQVQQDHPDADTAVALYRVEDLSVLFGVHNSMGPTRIYRFKLVNPDGSSCELVRFTNDEVPAPMEFDEFDQVVVQALSNSLTKTVCETYEVMVKPPRPTTHAGVTTLQ